MTLLRLARRHTRRMPVSFFFFRRLGARHVPVVSLRRRARRVHHEVFDLRVEHGGRAGERRERARQERRRGGGGVGLGSEARAFNRGDERLGDQPPRRRTRAEVAERRRERVGVGVTRPRLAAAEPRRGLSCQTQPDARRFPRSVPSASSAPRRSARRRDGPLRVSGRFLGRAGASLEASSHATRGGSRRRRGRPRRPRTRRRSATRPRPRRATAARLPSASRPRPSRRRRREACARRAPRLQAPPSEPRGSCARLRTSRRIASAERPQSSPVRASAAFVSRSASRAARRSSSSATLAATGTARRASRNAPRSGRAGTRFSFFFLFFRSRATNVSPSFSFARFRARHPPPPRARTPRRTSWRTPRATPGCAKRSLSCAKSALNQAHDRRRWPRTAPTNAPRQQPSLARRCAGLSSHTPRFQPTAKTLAANDASERGPP